MLRRLVALLVAFALLAERVAGRSAPVRCLVLWILRRAETAAADCVFEETGIPPAAFAGIVSVGNDPAAALCLARRFRALAAALCALLPLGSPFGRPARRAFAFGHVAQGSPRLARGPAREPNDTS